MMRSLSNNEANDSAAVGISAIAASDADEFNYGSLSGNTQVRRRSHHFQRYDGIMLTTAVVIIRDEACSNGR